MTSLSQKYRQAWFYQSNEVSRFTVLTVVTVYITGIWNMTYNDTVKVDVSVEPAASIYIVDKYYTRLHGITSKKGSLYNETFI
jgi:hypothetical protein